MKNMVVGMFAVLGLAACSDSDGGGTGGAGGIQEPETTSGSTGDQGTGGDASGSGGGDGCSIGNDGAALCEAIDACEPGKGDECVVDLAEERCTDTACLTVHDEWVACWKGLADADDIPECADFPPQCDSQRASWESCIGGDECVASPEATVVCEGVDACEPGNGDSCMEELESERCLYAEGSECQGLHDVYVGCVADLLIAGLWEECPDLPEACRAEWDDYASSCI